MIVVTTIPP